MPSSDDVTLGARIRALRESRGLAKGDLARTLGLDPSAATHIEKGSRKVSSSELARLAEFLGVSVLAILEPDSPLGRLAVSARVSTDTPAASVDVLRRAQALGELHQVLADAGVAPTTIETTVPAVKVAAWQSDAPQLAEWARERLKVVPTDTEGLATRIEDTFGIDVLLEHLPGGPLGLAATLPGFKLLWANSAQPRRQLLFTMAHELGHLLAGDTTAATVDETLTKHSPKERFANAFAANLLMPEDEIVEIVAGRAVDADVFLELYDRFGVSVVALTYRLHNLGLIGAGVRDRVKDLSAQALAAHCADEELGRKVMRTETSPTMAYHPPRLLTERALKGFLSGAVSVRPYAGLLQRDPDDVLDEFEAGAVERAFA